MKISARLFFLLLPVTLAGCAAAAPSRQDSHPQPPDKSTAKTSLDWSGSYAGNLPCADCAGIRMTISLRNDDHYLLTRQYASNKAEGIFRSQGSFHWLPGASEIELSSADGSGERFQVVENALVPLTGEGKALELGGKRWVLHKVSSQDSAQALYASYRWQLSKLPGYQTVATANGKKPYLVFDPAERSVSGWDGCNRIAGRVALGAENTLRFPALVSTRMACLGSNAGLETAFSTALNATRSFTWHGNLLDLQGENGKRLAQFTELAEPESSGH
ncbi:META domain-containing protein [Acidithiobacillus sp. CV18-2]|uniref:META domain-containing protein n=1 Tax=Igneacidithiobacillus copahuensis TaxID=2724909 RepID=A0AAE2YNH6_9PROT|nr:copper resistance protein NlpE N-terminal domain-containing protein [Igneacidithiobacillus copahuensis]MBU2754804.1 META domain-containing protein [Acidithiobacillus sp. CV18-3]MBU2757483.1 META domain-containing protein [Acidithiobacillus sp. BN09-2]MBU2777963.1 META domain-containing protein [Acidithiobacillus sp. CV18-2]MBU2796304.1 META domain-containing protein [Acidithiobacillus sp. VAN18-2]MBU2800072.1 META domain-containing protein [Acidithiobacillus sp. VAN18-4]